MRELAVALRMRDVTVSCMLRATMRSYALCGRAVSDKMKDFAVSHKMRGLAASYMPCTLCIIDTNHTE